MGTGLSAPWRKKTGLSRIRAWRSEGLSHKEIAGRMGITVRTLTSWKGRYPEIGAALTGREAAAEQAVSGKQQQAAVAVTTPTAAEATASPAAAKTATTPAAAEAAASPAAVVTAEESAAMAASAAAAASVPEQPSSAPAAGKPLISLELLPINADVHTLARDAGLLPLAPSADDKQLQSLVESALLRRALGYRYATVTQELRKDPVTGDMVMTVTKRIDKEVPPDTTAQLYWLKSRDPDRWRDKHPDEPAGDGEVIVTFDVDEEEPQEDSEDWDGDE